MVPFAKRVLAALLVFVLFAAFTLAGTMLARDLFSTYTELPDAQAALQGILLQTILVFGAAFAVVAAIALYLALTLRTKARLLAEQLTEGLSFSQAQFKQFYELSPVPYLLVSPAGIVDRPNKASVRFFGEAADTLIGKNFIDYIVPSEKEGQDDVGMVREHLTRKVPLEKREMRVEAKQGANRWVLLSMGMIRTEGSDAFWGLITLADITEQKELDQIKTEFLSLASHQLRTPLANVRWYIEFLLLKRTDQLTEEVSNFLGEIRLRNQQMIELVNTLLNLSRLEMGRMVVEKEQADITALVKDVVSELTPQAKQKQITVSTELGAQLNAETDPRLLRVVIQNLLSNAVRYTPASGNVTVRVDTTSDGYTVSVSDTGCGIPPEEQDRIFTKLYRASNARKIEANGNGIGLYMSKEIVEALGGTLDFTTELDKGTTFTMSLS